MNNTVESTVNSARGNEFPFHHGASAKAVPIFYIRIVGPPRLNRNDTRHPRSGVQYAIQIVNEKFYFRGGGEGLRGVNRLSQM